jgi:hypothetical protein
MFTNNENFANIIELFLKEDFTEAHKTLDTFLNGNPKESQRISKLLSIIPFEHMPTNGIDLPSLQLNTASIRTFNEAHTLPEFLQAKLKVKANKKTILNTLRLMDSYIDHNYPGLSSETNRKLIKTLTDEPIDITRRKNRRKEILSSKIPAPIDACKSLADIIDLFLQKKFTEAHSALDKFLKHPLDKTSGLHPTRISKLLVEMPFKDYGTVAITSECLTEHPKQEESLVQFLEQNLTTDQKETILDSLELIYSYTEKNYSSALIGQDPSVKLIKEILNKERPKLIVETPIVKDVYQDFKEIISLYFERKFLVANTKLEAFLEGGYRSGKNALHPKGLLNLLQAKFEDYKDYQIKVQVPSDLNTTLSLVGWLKTNLDESGDLNEGAAITRAIELIENFIKKNAIVPDSKVPLQTTLLEKRTRASAQALSAGEESLSRIDEEIAKIKITPERPSTATLPHAPNTTKHPTPKENDKSPEIDESHIEKKIAKSTTPPVRPGPETLQDAPITKKRSTPRSSEIDDPRMGLKNNIVSYIEQLNPNTKHKELSCLQEVCGADCYKNSFQAKFTRIVQACKNFTSGLHNLLSNLSLFGCFGSHGRDPRFQFVYEAIAHYDVLVKKYPNMQTCDDFFEAYHREQTVKRLEDWIIRLNSEDYTRPYRDKTKAIRNEKTEIIEWIIEVVKQPETNLKDPDLYENLISQVVPRKQGRTVQNILETKRGYFFSASSLNTLKNELDWARQQKQVQLDCSSNAVAKIS